MKRLKNSMAALRLPRNIRTIRSNFYVMRTGFRLWGWGKLMLRTWCLVLVSMLPPLMRQAVNVTDSMTCVTLVGRKSNLLTLT